VELALIRHTRCDVPAGTCYGHLDVPLAHTASADIELTLSRVPPVDLVFSSPSRRCHSLAQALAARDQCEIRVRDELRELNFGTWEGRRWDDIRRSESDTWAADPWNIAPPNGESENQLWQRVALVAAEVLQTADAMSADCECRAAAPSGRAVVGPGLTAVARHGGPRRIAVVSHGGPLRHLRCQLTGTPSGDRWSWSIDCGAVALIDYCPTRINLPVFGSLNT
jgi:alpha-ribazole phosphatase